jgi:hypothetical protein
MRGFNSPFELGSTMYISALKNVGGRTPRLVRIQGVKGRAGSDQQGRVVVFEAEDQTRLLSDALSVSFALGVVTGSAPSSAPTAGTTAGSTSTVATAQATGGITQLTGDVAAGPGTGAQAATIQNDAVTYAKMQNVSAASRLLGRGSAGGSGDPQEISLDSSLTMSGTTLSVTGGIPGTGGRLIGIQRITATGAYTYTPTSGTNFIVVELQGAGGGGGGVPNPGTFNSAVAAGGGGGGWLRVKLSSNFSGATGSVGAGGTGGAAGANNGTTGGNTTFVTTGGSPTTYTAGGGGGGGQTSGTPTQAVGGTAGGVCTNGDDQRPGTPASGGAAFPGPFFAYSGAGGDSPYSGGGQCAFIAANPGSAAGISATGRGGGGSGAVANGNTTARAGGNGSDGLVVIWEFS